MPEQQYGEPWTPGDFTPDGSSFTVTSNDGDQAKSNDLTLRIAACLNFCREFPTEALLNRRLIYITENSEFVGKSLAELEGFDGCIAVTLTPTVKDQPAKTAGIDPMLDQGQPHERLDAGSIPAAGSLETNDETL